MTPLGLAVLIGWALCAVYGFRVVFRDWIGDFGTDDPADVMLGVLIASLLGCIAGPFIAWWHAFLFVTGGDLSRTARLLAGESREQKAKRLEREREDREQYIGKLERELGIGQLNAPSTQTDLTINRDRVVHAILRDGSELCWYHWNRHWYVEHPDGLRQQVKVGQAVELAKEADVFFFDLPGGTRLNYRLRKELA